MRLDSKYHSFIPYKKNKTSKAVVVTCHKLTIAISIGEH